MVAGERKFSSTYDNGYKIGPWVSSKGQFFLGWHVFKGPLCSEKRKFCSFPWMRLENAWRQTCGKQSKELRILPVSFLLYFKLSKNYELHLTFFSAKNAFPTVISIKLFEFLQTPPVDNHGWVAPFIIVTIFTKQTEIPMVFKTFKRLKALESIKS